MTTLTLFAAFTLPQQAAAAAPAVNGTYFKGIPMVGTFFADTASIRTGATACTGTVVHSPTRDLVLTAAHCGRPRLFVPQYRYGAPASAQPYGVHRVTALFTDPAYPRDTDLDIAFARVATPVEARTGALTLTPTATYTHRVTVIGYPSDPKVNRHHQPLSCTTSTTRLTGHHQLRMACGGYYGGTSGGPWITSYNPATRTGSVIGNTGGYEAGGNVHWISYAPVYGGRALALYTRAVAAGRR
ncbi:trypsin-like serine peptidase [Streptomyces sp. NBC_01465]|uniref:trypsin-like serine peptidase n=1 Tax=Streptomyces sp. NBC_01465 TaxID=2903878 RepID=UPI002E3434FA|nr:trypsin-like serine protease [Streptomyces sp. NBC_01465]